MMTVELKQSGERARQQECLHLREASERVREFIESNDLGARTWEGGLVRVDGKLKFRVSYNGRVWVYRPGGVTDNDDVEVTGRELDVQR